MKINTGTGYMPIKIYIAILSLSAITSLPGLAVSPILGKLHTIFLTVSQTEIDMLTSLPSLLIIPFVLLSGKLAASKGSINILRVGLVIFTLSGVLYMMAKSMMMLILVSCMLGAGAGLVIPLSTGMIADHFSGNQRVRQLGISSSVNNLTLVLVTYLTGWLAVVKWDLPFLVYLLAAIPLFLSVYLKRESKSVNSSSKDTQTSTVTNKINIAQLLSIMGLYFFITYGVLAVIFNLPFAIESRKLNSSISGTVISLFFLSIMTPGFFISHIIKRFGGYTIIASLSAMAIGLFLITLGKGVEMIIMGAMICGVGYGVLQPLIYDKTTQTSSAGKVTLALAFVMATNYLAILLYPFINGFLKSFLYDNNDMFAFRMNMLLMVIAIVLAYLKRDGFLFSVKEGEK